MQFETLGQRLLSLRNLAGLRQSDVAARVGVHQGVYSRWERDERPVPPAMAAPLAAALGVEVAVLEEVNPPQRSGGRPILPRILKAGYRSTFDPPPYEVKGTFDEVQWIDETARVVCQRSSARLTPAQLGLVEKSYPRDSKWELLIIHHLFAVGGRPFQLTLGQQRCPLLTVDDYGSLRLEQHTRRHCIILERDPLLFVFTPQVWVVSPTQGEWYRLDFLCGIFDGDGNARFADVEFDTYFHDNDYDRRRARGICAPRIKLVARDVCNPDFVPRLLGRLEALLAEPEPDYRAHQKKAG